MLLIKIDKKSNSSIFQQIVEQTIRMIKTEALSKGARLPATRELAVQLGINRSTVVRAYEELWSLGYVTSEMGGYTYVRERKQIVQSTTALANEESNISLFRDRSQITKAYEIGSSEAAILHHQNCINMQKLEPDYRLIDRAKFRKICRELLHSSEINPFSYAPAQGYKPLKEAIIKHMQLHQLFATDKQVLISSGTQSALHLIFEAYSRPGDTIYIEAPTYSMLLPLIKYYKLNVEEVPICTDGMDIDYLRERLKREPAQFIYTMPTFHNPTGITMNQEKREELLDLCENHDIVLIEDSIEEEMKYFDKVHLPIKSMDIAGRVIYLGSFAKVLSPGMRISWIIAHTKVINQLQQLKTIFHLSGNTFSQMLICKYMQEGFFELHLKKLARTYRSRMELALSLLKKEAAGTQIHWNIPIGGYLIWLEFPTYIKHITLESHFQKYGVKITDGAKFFYTPPKRSFIRLSIAQCNNQELAQGIKRIGRAIGDLSSTYNA